MFTCRWISASFCVCVCVCATFLWWHLTHEWTEVKREPKRKILRNKQREWSHFFRDRFQYKKDGIAFEFHHSPHVHTHTLPREERNEDIIVFEKANGLSVLWTSIFSFMPYATVSSIAWHGFIFAFLFWCRKFIILFENQIEMKWFSLWIYLI